MTMLGFVLYAILDSISIKQPYFVREKNACKKLRKNAWSVKITTTRMKVKLKWKVSVDHLGAKL